MVAHNYTENLREINKKLEEKKPVFQVYLFLVTVGISHLGISLTFLFNDDYNSFRLWFCLVILYFSIAFVTFFLKIFWKKILHRGKKFGMVVAMIIIIILPFFMTYNYMGEPKGIEEVKGIFNINVSYFNSEFFVGESYIYIEDRIIPLNKYCNYTTLLLEENLSLNKSYDLRIYLYDVRGD